MRNCDKSKIHTEREKHLHTFEQIGVMQKEKELKTTNLDEPSKGNSKEGKIIQKKRETNETFSFAHKIRQQNLIESFANYIVKPIYNRFAMRLFIFGY